MTVKKNDGKFGMWGVMMEDWIYVTKSSMPPIKNYVRHLYDLWETRHLTNQGEKHEQLEQTLASELGVANVTLTANGHLALELALKALSCKGEVITTPFTFASTTQAIINSGCTPVFCDIDPSTLTIDASKIESLITPNTSAILAVHVFGRACDVEQIDAIAKKHHLRVIYDGAHAYKLKVNDIPISEFGDCTMFSFHATKLFHAVEGGALATNDAILAKQFETLRNFGIVDEEMILEGGTNAKMSEFHAAMGLCNVPYVDEWILQRKQLYDRYVEQLNSVDGITIPHLQDGVTPNYSYFPILLDMDREGLIEHLKEHRIMARKYFYPLTSCIVRAGEGHGENTSEPYLQREISDADKSFDEESVSQIEIVDKSLAEESFTRVQAEHDLRNQFDHSNKHVAKKSVTPVASSIADCVLCLPLYADLTIQQVDRICTCIQHYVQMTATLKLGEVVTDVVI